MAAGFFLAGRVTLRRVLPAVFRYRLLLQPLSLVLCLVGAGHPDALAPAVILTLLDQYAGCLLQQWDRKDNQTCNI